MTVNELLAAISQAAAEGKGDRPVQIVEVINGFPVAFDMFIDITAGAEERGRVLVWRSPYQEAPRWVFESSQGEVLH